VTVPVDFADDWLEAVYGENVIGDGRLYDPDKHWFGTALSGFGIVYNRDVLAQLGLDEPAQWEDLCHPRLAGWVALVNPGQSGSITTAFDTILQRRGWEHGWRILRRAGANARYFSASALKGPTDVSQGNAAMGVCIDFYGRYQAQAIKTAGPPGAGERLGYIDPPGATSIDPDPISMLRSAPNPDLARRFIEFCLTEEGQALWQFQSAASAAGSLHSAPTAEADGLGPERYELRRLPVLRLMYERHMERMIDQVNPFEIAAPLADPNPHFRDFIAVVFAAAVMDTHAELRRAWRAIVSHPAYPGEGLITAADVTDPVLAEMLALFDAMPTAPGPDGRLYALDRPADLGPLRSGWLRGGWSDHRLWHPETTPADELRRRFTRFFRENYQRIVELAE
jgi:iron(III) transport system substrate-binding protein